MSRHDRLLQRRRFIRHPVDIPLEVSSACTEGAPGRATNLGGGGLAFEHSEALRPGDRVRIRIPLVVPPFESQAEVCWCRRRRRGWLVGVAFTSAEARYRMRMVEQVCHIERYRTRLARRRRAPVSSADAAAEWITRFAAEFPPYEG